MRLLRRDVLELPLTELRAELKRVAPNPPRRLGPLAELALAGAWRCLGDVSLLAETGLVLASRYAARAETEEALRSVLELHEPPMPVSFINTQPTTVLQALAQQVGAHGPALLVSGECDALAAGMWLARNVLESGTAPAVLVSVLDWEGERGEAVSLLLALDGEGTEIPDTLALDARKFLHSLDEGPRP
ncbi:MAG: hypothetical protein HYV16_07735 [Gammaproteobacteria bacterium]|nr:hypothetical protein [Gammaproteobacteria bacterium]